MDNQQERLNGQNEAPPHIENDNRPESSIDRLKKKFLPGLKGTLLITIAFNFIMLVIGCYGIHKCPVNENIPLFLIATGGIGLFSKFISYVRDRILKHFQVKYLESALYTVETIFLILGAYWVFKEYKPSYDPRDGRFYCQKTVYMFAFIYILFFIVLAIVMISGFLCFLICVFFVKRYQKENVRDPEAQVQINNPTENNQNVPRN